jgi:hypothetical protein
MKNKTNEVLATALVTNEATTALIAQIKPLHLYEVFAQKTSHKGVSCGFLMPKTIPAGTMKEAEYLFVEENGGVDAVATDEVGTWKVIVNCVA